MIVCVVYFDYNILIAFDFDCAEQEVAHVEAALVGQLKELNGTVFELHGVRLLLLLLLLVFLLARCLSRRCRQNWYGRCRSIQTSSFSCVFVVSLMFIYVFKIVFLLYMLNAEAFECFFDEPQIDVKLQTCLVNVDGLKLVSIVCNVFQV